MTTIPPDDPLRRKPTTIDLGATEVKADGAARGRTGSVPATGPSKDETASRAGPKPPAAPAVEARPAGPAPSSDAPPASAVEPMAATGLDWPKPAAGPLASPGPGGPGTAPGPTPSPSAPAKPGAASARPEAASAKPDAAAPLPAPAARSGAGSLLAASVVGGLVGAGLLYAAERYAAPQPEDLGPRVAALESRPATPADAAPPQALLRRIDALEAGRQELAGAVAQARSQAEAAARQAAEAAGRPAAAAGAGASAPDPAIGQAIEGLQGRLAAAEGSAASALEAARTAGDAAKAAAAALPEQVDALRTRVDGRFGALEASLASLGNGGASLRTDLGAAQAGLAELRAGQQDAAARIAAAESGIEAIRGRADESARRIEEQGRQVQAASADLARLSPAAIEAGLRLVVADRLADAIRTGVPLGAATASLARLGADPAALAPLKPFAGAPPPDIAALAREFTPLAERMTTEPRPAATSIGDRLLRMADKIVAVRDLGDGSGTDLPGLVGRIEASLGRGDAPGALAAWTALPETARSISAAWAEKLKGRVAAEDAARDLGRDALAALDAAAPAAATR